MGGRVWAVWSDLVLSLEVIWGIKMGGRVWAVWSDLVLSLEVISGIKMGGCRCSVVRHR